MHIVMHNIIHTNFLSFQCVMMWPLKYTHPSLVTALPTLDIAEGGLDALMSLYKQLLPKWGGYLTLAGDLNHSRLEQLLTRLGAMEQEVLQARAEVRLFEGWGCCVTGGICDWRYL